MDAQIFLQTINAKAKEAGINPLLLISGIEGLYTFKDVQLNAINYEFLDSLILTIFALRIGDQFHTIAEQNMESESMGTRIAAEREMEELSTEQINNSNNQYLQSFAAILDGKSIIRRYHQKALEVAALEIKNAQTTFNNASIGAIILTVSKDYLSDTLDLSSLFAQ